MKRLYLVTLVFRMDTLIIGVRKYTISCRMEIIVRLSLGLMRFIKFSLRS